MGISSVRCIDVAAGNVTTIAGFTGQQGHMDGVATVAQFWEISSLAVDHTRTRRLTWLRTGTTPLRAQPGPSTVKSPSRCRHYTATQLRDGTGHWSRFNNPFGIAFDSQYTRSVYIADYSNYAVRSIHGGCKAPTVSPTTINPTITQTPLALPRAVGTLSTTTSRRCARSRRVSIPRTRASWPCAMTLHLLCVAVVAARRRGQHRHGRGEADWRRWKWGGRDGSLTKATFGVPAGLDIDCWNTTQPYLYLADDTRDKIRRLNMAQAHRRHHLRSGRTVTATASTCPARFNRPRGLVVRRLNAPGHGCFTTTRPITASASSRSALAAETRLHRGGLRRRLVPGWCRDTCEFLFPTGSAGPRDFGADTLLYIADSVRVRELNLTSMVVNTLVGAGISSSSTAHIDGPVSYGKVLDHQGLATVDATRDAPFVYLSRVRQR